MAPLLKNQSAMQETWVWSLGWDDPLQKGKATNSSILAWRIPWTVESMGLQRVEHSWMTFTSLSLLGSLAPYQNFMYHIFFIHSSGDGRLGCFCVLAAVNSAAVDIGVHVSFRIVFSRCMSSSGIAGSYVSSIFSFLRNFHTVLHSGFTNSYSHQQCSRVPFSTSFPAFICGCSVTAVLAGMGWPFFVVLICTSLVTSDAADLCICLVDHLSVFFGEMSV